MLPEPEEDPDPEDPEPEPEDPEPEPDDPEPVAGVEGLLGAAEPN